MNYHLNNDLNARKESAIIYALQSGLISKAASKQKILVKYILDNDKGINENTRQILELFLGDGK